MKELNWKRTFSIIKDNKKTFIFNLLIWLSMILSVFSVLFLLFDTANSLFLIALLLFPILNFGVYLSSYRLINKKNNIKITFAFKKPTSAYSVQFKHTFFSLMMALIAAMVFSSICFSIIIFQLDTDTIMDFYNQANSVQNVTNYLLDSGIYKYWESYINIGQMIVAGTVFFLVKSRNGFLLLLSFSYPLPLQNLKPISKKLSSRKDFRNLNRVFILLGILFAVGVGAIYLLIKPHIDEVLGIFLASIIYLIIILPLYFIYIHIKSMIFMKIKIEENKLFFGINNKLSENFLDFQEDLILELDEGQILIFYYNMRVNSNDFGF